MSGASVKQQLSRCYTGCGSGSDPVLKEKSGQLVRQCVTFLFLQSIFYHPHSTLHQSVRGWMIGCYSGMADSIETAKLLKLCCCKMGAVIGH